MMENMQQRIETICADKEFNAKLSMCSTSSEIAELFTANGVPISADEIEKLLVMTAKQDQDELDADQLDVVSGGALAGVGSLLLPLLPRLPITLPVMPIRKVTK